MLNETRTNFGVERRIIFQWLWRERNKFSNFFLKLSTYWTCSERWLRFNQMQRKEKEEEKKFCECAWGGADFTHVSIVYLNLHHRIMNASQFLWIASVQINQNVCVCLFQKYVKHSVAFLFDSVSIELRDSRKANKQTKTKHTHRIGN